MISFFFLLFSITVLAAVAASSSGNSVSTSILTSSMALTLHPSPFPISLPSSTQTPSLPLFFRHHHTIPPTYSSWISSNLSPYSELYTFLSETLNFALFTITSNVLELCVYDKSFGISQFGEKGLFAAVDDIFCVFRGHIENLPFLRQLYGLSKVTNEAIMVIEAYRTLRDRGPYPVDKVVKDFHGNFAFILFDGTKNRLCCCCNNSTYSCPIWVF
ncbi:unnamed protein product [Eruca vesicaria subsp. sativa]|uniref:DUF3700 domain-containing protein n=1 Tax=Eruca vesicaria subsp. sativa TaxID=29727 RepID=A0ABC8K304_ERUVS|nr:unnamed protein product [Eruca vesicaria subsp. sativa]